MTRKLVWGDFSDTHTVKMYREPETNEYIVRLYEKTPNGLKLIPDADYFGTEKQESKETGKAMLKHANLKAGGIRENKALDAIMRKNPIKGPGKFEGETYLARYAYENPDEETGSVDELGWYGRFSGKVKGRGPFHVIVNEDSQGFVNGVIYNTEREMQRDWRRIEKEYERYYREFEE